MAGEPQTPTNSRYSLRQRTPAKPSQPAAPVATPTPRKRTRAAASSAGRGRKSARGRGGRGFGKRPTVVSSPSAISSSDASSEDEEVEDANPRRKHPNGTYRQEEDDTDGEKPARRGPGRPRKPSGSPQTPGRRSWDVRRIPVHLTKHDAFRPVYLDEVARIMGQIPANDQAYSDRYEQMKMSEALKLCGYELGVADADSESLQDVYRLLSWSVHSAGPQGAVHPAPPLSDAGKSVLLKVFASIGSRIREETRDMAGYHRRHALRKLILADRETAPDGVLRSEMAMRGAASRRNPLRIPAPLIDIWKEPYKKSAESQNAESQVSD